MLDYFLSCVPPASFWKARRDSSSEFSHFRPKSRDWLRESRLCKTMPCHVLFLARLRTFGQRLQGCLLLRVCRTCLPIQFLDFIGKTQTKVMVRFFFRPDFVPLPCPCDSSYPASHFTKDASLQQAALLSINVPFIVSCEFLVLKAAVRNIGR